MKDFLYLVQSRAEMAEKHLELQSPRADILIYTFDKPINQPNFIYKPNTLWAEGRNILIDAAHKMNKKYKYYILLDDDIGFVKGGFTEFEDEVINVEPDLCTPFYWSPLSPMIQNQAKLVMFRYSSLRHADCSMVCVGRELFFEDAFLPYATELCKTPFYYNSYYSNVCFWSNVFTNFANRKIICASRIWHTNNIVSHEKYNLNYRTSQLMLRMHGENGNRDNPLYKHLLFERCAARKKELRYRKIQFKKVMKRIIKSGKMIANLYVQRRLKYYISFLYFNIIYKFLKWKEQIAASFYRVALVGLIRDIKLNAKL